jgi:hypothetical protein
VIGFFVILFVTLIIKKIYFNKWFYNKNEI